MEGIYPLTVTLTEKEAIMRKSALIVREAYLGKRKVVVVNLSNYQSILNLLDFVNLGQSCSRVSLRRGCFYDNEIAIYYVSTRGRLFLH